MQEISVVSREEWLEARQAHLRKEKEFTRLRDELSRERRSLPWVQVNKEYLFDTLDGQLSLSDLFEGRSQLIVQHFMFGPDWGEGCKSCSFWTDNFNDITVHLAHRDISFVVISRGQIEKMEAYKHRMGWDVRWVSSLNNDFNFDYAVSFKQEQIEQGQAFYNFGSAQFGGDEAPGITVFFKNDAGEIFHTYSTYSRGLDMLNGAYHLMDLVPKGRDEDQLPWSMAWLQRHDEYSE